mmetsp:Transcript_20679/g.48290  ORF Transcript_20679/g.48290 Transcript_20679/m.48290 type:complete len:243 (+) Transcript_20679:108-836(+)
MAPCRFPCRPAHGPGPGAVHAKLCRLGRRQGLHAKGWQAGRLQRGHHQHVAPVEVPLHSLPRGIRGGLLHLCSSGATWRSQGACPDVTRSLYPLRRRQWRRRCGLPLDGAGCHAPDPFARHARVSAPHAGQSVAQLSASALHPDRSIRGSHGHLERRPPLRDGPRPWREVGLLHGRSNPQRPNPSRRPALPRYHGIGRVSDSEGGMGLCAAEHVRGRAAQDVAGAALEPAVGSLQDPGPSLG